jgi:uncharacterized protein YoxC
MGEVLQTNIFFFITAAAVIILTIFLSIICFHVIKITKSVRQIVERIEEGSEVLIDDIQHVREVVGGTSTMLSHLLGLKASIRQERGGTTKPRKRKSSKLSIKDES